MKVSFIIFVFFFSFSAVLGLEEGSDGVNMGCDCKDYEDRVKLLEKKLKSQKENAHWDVLDNLKDSANSYYKESMDFVASQLDEETLKYMKSFEPMVDSGKKSLSVMMESGKKFAKDVYEVVSPKLNEVHEKSYPEVERLYKKGSVEAKKLLKKAVKQYQRFRIDSVKGMHSSGFLFFKSSETCEKIFDFTAFAVFFLIFYILFGPLLSLCMFILRSPFKLFRFLFRQVINMFLLPFYILFAVTRSFTGRGKKLKAE